MNITRRGFLKSCLALAAAPAIVKAENIMRIWTPPQGIVIADALGTVSLNDGAWHHVQIVRSWLGTERTRFFIDNTEVAGIDGVEYTGDCVKIGPPGGQVSYQTTMPKYRPGQEFTFNTTVKMPPSQTKEMHIGSTIIQEGRGPDAFTSYSYNNLVRI